MPPNGALKHILAYLCRAPPRRRRSVAARADLAVVMGWEKKGVPDESWSDGPGSGPRLPRGCRRESQSGVWASTFAAELGCGMLMLRRRRRGGGSNLGQAGEGQPSVGRRKKAIGSVLRGSGERVQKWGMFPEVSPDRAASGGLARKAHVMRCAGWLETGVGEDWGKAMGDGWRGRNSHGSEEGRAVGGVGDGGGREEEMGINSPRVGNCDVAVWRAAELALGSHHRPVPSLCSAPASAARPLPLHVHPRRLPPPPRAPLSLPAPPQIMPFCRHPCPNQPFSTLFSRHHLSSSLSSSSSSGLCPRPRVAMLRPCLSRPPLRSRSSTA